MGAKAMHVGLCRVKLLIHDRQSLKGKRGVVKSIVGRVGNRFNVSVAEVDDHDRWQLATLGIACVSTDARHANQVLSKVVEFIRTSHRDAELQDYEIELLPAF